MIQNLPNATKSIFIVVIIIIIIAALAINNTTTAAAAVAASHVVIIVKCRHLLAMHHLLFLYGANRGNSSRSSGWVWGRSDSGGII